MKKEIFISLAVSLMACSDDKMSGTASEPNAANVELEKVELSQVDSTVVKGLMDEIKDEILLMKNGHYVADSVNDLVVVDIPTLVYPFSTEKEKCHEFYGNGGVYACFVNNYAEEQGVMQTKSSQGSVLDRTYLIKENEGSKYVLQLIEGSYWGNEGDCAADSVMIVNECKSRGGFVEDYYQGCYDNILVLSCGWKADERADLKMLTTELVKDCENFESTLPEEPAANCYNYLDEDGDSVGVCLTKETK